VVRLAEVSKLRLGPPGPESIAGQIHLADPVKVHVQRRESGHRGQGVQVRWLSWIVNATMETEI